MITLKNLSISYKKENRIIKALNLSIQDKTIIITSHIIETLTNLCDFIHFLEDGKIKYSKEKKEFAEFEKSLFEDIENKNKGIIEDLI